MWKYLSKRYLFFVAFLPIVITISSASAISSNISHSYKGSGNLINGNIVSLDPQQQDYVQASNVNNSSKLIGVVVSEAESLLAEDSSGGTVQIATQGTVDTLVSTINGSITVGDQIAVSPINGVGMNAQSGSRIIGLAQTTLNNSTSGSKVESIKNQQGKSVNVRVGFVQLNIAIGTNATVVSTQTNNVQKFVQQLTGHTVSTTRIIISLIILIIAILTLISLIYSAIYGTIIAIGRNPLAKHTILRSFGGVIAMCTFIAIIAIAAMFLLLK
jgi:hypothetical protein